MEATQSSWFILKKSLFVDFVKNNYISIYDTESNITMTSKDIVFIDIIKTFYVPENLGCIEYSSDIVSDDFEKAKLLGFISVIKAEKRPINLLPILSLLSDLQRGNNLKERISLLGSKLALVSGLKIELAPMLKNDSDPLITKDRTFALRQYCYYTGNSERLQEVRILCSILKHLFLTSISIVDLYCNRDFIVERNMLEIVIQSIPSYIRVNLHLMIDEYESAEKAINAFVGQNDNIQLKLYADRYSDKKTFFRYIDGQKSLSFFVYSKDDLCLVEQNKDCVNICPVVLKDNINWIKSCISLPQKDISTGSYSFTQLFRNMKLNTNFFGIIDIDINGNVKAHGAKNIIGNLSDINFSLVDVVNEELQNNESWRQTRNTYAKCSICGFRYLCPPISIFELQGLIDCICQ